MNIPFQLVLQAASEPRQFTAFVPSEDGEDRIAESTFEWNTDSPSLPLTLGALEGAALSGSPPADNLHVKFGQLLFNTIFSGPVGDLWRQRITSLEPGDTLPLVLRPDPVTARPLLNLPWEYLHDGDSFVALNWRTPISRLPWGLPMRSLPPITEPLRVLVVISAPHGLGHNEIPQYAPRRKPHPDCSL